MEIAYLFIVIFLFTLAIIDLTVGVSNDAVNFLSAAVGSKAAKLKWILPAMEYSIPTSSISGK